MRRLSALLLGGFLLTFSAVISPAPPSRAMQPAPTPPSDASRTFCSEDGEARGDALGIFDPLQAEVGVVEASDVEQPETTDESRRLTGNLRLNALTLPADTCLLGSVFYPAALISVTAGTIQIFVEPGPGAPPDAPAPAPVGTIWKGAAEGEADLVFPGPITITAGQWVRLANRAIVGFRNQGPGDATFLVAGIHPTSAPGSGDCSSGCRSRP